MLFRPGRQNECYSAKVLGRVAPWRVSVDEVALDRHDLRGTCSRDAESGDEADSRGPEPTYRIGSGPREPDWSPSPRQIVEVRNWSALFSRQLPVDRILGRPAPLVDRHPPESPLSQRTNTTLLNEQYRMVIVLPPRLVQLWSKSGAKFRRKRPQAAEIAEI